MFKLRISRILLPGVFILAFVAKPVPCNPFFGFGMPNPSNNPFNSFYNPSYSSSYNPSYNPFMPQSFMPPSPQEKPSFFKSLFSFSKNPSSGSIKEKSVGKRKVVFGKDVKDSKQLYNYRYTYSFSSKQRELSFDFRYPVMSFGLFYSPKITKIEVLFEEIDDDATPAVYIRDGGIGETHASLEIKAQNTHMLHYRVKVYGK